MSKIFAQARLIQCLYLHITIMTDFIKKYTSQVKEANFIAVSKHDIESIHESTNRLKVITNEARRDNEMWKAIFQQASDELEQRDVEQQPVIELIGRQEVEKFVTDLQMHLYNHKFHKGELDIATNLFEDLLLEFFMQKGGVK